MGRYVNKILWAFSFFLFYNNCYAQIDFYFTKNLPFKSKSVLSGIRQIDYFLKDSRGYAWFAAQGGLYRYDGYQTKWYSTDEARPNSKSSSPAKAIAEDKYGNIWVAVGGIGLKKLDTKTDSLIGVSLEMPHESQYLINELKHEELRISNIIASEDDLWLSCIYSNYRYSISTHKLQIAPNFKKCTDLNHNLWGIYGDTEGFKIYQYAKQRDTFLLKTSHPTKANFYEILLATKEHIYVSFDKKLMVYDIAANKCFFPQNFENQYTYSMHLNTDNTILVHQNSTIFSLDPTTFKTTPILTNSFLSYYDIYPLSNNQLLLTGDNSSRLLNLSPPVIEPYNLNIRSRFGTEVLKDASIYPYDAHQVNINNAYIADFEKNKLSKFESLNPALKNISTDLLSIGQYVKLYVDKEGMHWYAYFNVDGDRPEIEFYMYTPKTKSLINLGSFASDTLYEFSASGFVKTDDKLYVADYWGLNAFDIHTKKWESPIQHAPADTIPDLITDLYVDNDDNLWVSTQSKGVILKKKGQNEFKYYSIKIDDKKNWASEWVSCVIQDKKGTVWIGTSKGLFTFDKKTEKLQKYDLHLPDNFIISIVLDDAQTLWLSHDKGITHFDPHKNTIRNYNEADGLLSEEIGRGIKLLDGSLIFYSAGRFYRINPQNVTLDSTPIPIYLTDIQLFNKPIEINGADSLLKQHISFTKSITFKHDQNIISLHYIAIDFVDAENRQYAYFLENFDTDWQYVGQKQEAVYTNLPPGKYTFRVKSANRDGIWIEMTTPLSITVLPPWWKTWWAYLFYILVVTGSIWAFMNYRARNLLRQNKLLENCVEERTAIVVAQKEELNETLNELKSTQTQLIQSEKLASLGELTAGIAHEIQNPLNFVNNFSELSVDLVKDLKEEMQKSSLTPEGEIILSDKAYFNELFDDLSQNQEKINHHGKRASSIVKGMLEHSRASTGVKELTDINKLADEYLRLSYHGLRAKDKSFNANFNMDFDENLPKIEVIPQDLGRVLLNLINNAFYAVNALPPNHPKKELHASDNYVPTVNVSTHYQTPHSGAGGNGSIIIKIKDNGIGMAEATKAKIFQPFFTTKPTGQGTGLGLSLAYDIVTKGHSGTLEVNSTEGVGSEFIIRLPMK